MINRPVSFFILTFFLLSGALADLKRELKLEWEPIEGASQYELQLTPSESSSTAETQEPLKVKVNEAKWVGSITPGQYKMKIRSFDDRQVPGPWSDEIDVEVKLPFVQIIEPKNKKVIPSEQDKEQSIKFSWKPIYGAKEYEWVITNKDNTITDKKNTEAPELETDLEVAQTYRWNVTPIFEADQRGPSNPTDFVFKLMGKALEPPEIEKPSTRLVREIKWSSPEYSKSFSYILQKKHATLDKWKTVEKAKKIELNMIPFKEEYPAGTYRISVKAHGEDRKSSPFAQMEFEVDKDRSPAAIEEQALKESLKKPSQFYGIASYFVTQINYKAYAAEYDSPSSFKTVGGTGRLGLGYNFTDSPWGVFVIVDAGGFVQSGKNRVFTSAEVHTTWSTDFGGAQRFLIGGGVYQKELPYFANSDPNLGADGEVYQTAKQNGLHIGLEYWKPISQKLGFQVILRQYMGLESGDAPENTSLQPSDSTQMGFLGSYRLSSSMMGFMGYNYKKDIIKLKAAQPANTATTSTSEINFEGHYLNFKLEIEF